MPEVVPSLAKASRGSPPGASDVRSVFARVGSALVWYVLPGLVLLAVVAYIAGATLGHANPPVVPVAGVSMRPTLQAGDLVFLEGVDPRTLHKGDIIGVDVPRDAQKKYQLPAHIVHRIAKVGHDQYGLVFTTKGDANAGSDVFVVHSNDVVGKMWFKATGLGYPFLFFRSRQGEIFLAAAALVAILYFGLGLIEERRIVVEGTAVTMQTVLDETQVLKEAITRVETMRALPPTGVPPAVTASGTPAPLPELDELVGEVRDANARSRETSEVMRELVGAIGEYGTHLRSHTEVMVNLAATTRELQEATVEMREAIVGTVALPTGFEPSDVAEPAALPQGASEPPAAARPPAAAESPVGLGASTTPELPAVIAPPTAPPISLRRAFRGYSPESVDMLLATFTRRLEEAEQRLAELAQRNAQLEDDIARYRRVEASIAETLRAAENAAAELRERAEQQAEDIVAATQENAAGAQRKGPQERPSPPSMHPGRRDDIGEGVYLPE